jgi:SAM-dependent methyltransferase
MTNSKAPTITIKESYTPGYTPVAIRYMMRRHAARDAAFFLPLLKPWMTVLDCGCGPGTITIGLAEVVTSGTVVGVDVEPSQIELANKTVQDRGLQNIRIQQASVYRLPFPDNTFHAVFSHALFEHLADPSAALCEIRRVLMPSGLVGIASPDWGGVLISPPDAEVDQAMQLYTLLQTRNGGNPFVGRELGPLLQTTGFVDVTLAATYDCYERTSLICDLLAERIATSAVPGAAPGIGMLDAMAIAKLVQALARWAERPQGLFAQSFVTAVGRADK